MADRYWVGGTADWNNVDGLKWATTSGGTGGAPDPTTADDVFFDAASTGTVTIALGNAGAKSINCTGFTGTLTGTTAITVAGSVTLAAGMTYTHTGTVTFTGTGTLTTAGKTFSGVTVNGGGITLTLGGALSMASRIVTFIQGTFDTANYSVTAGRFTPSTTNAKTVTLGSSTINLSSAPAWDIGNATLDAGTSQINLTTANSMNGGGKTYYNVSFTGNVASTSTTSNRRFLGGQNTFNNLTFAAPTTGIANYILAGDQTVNGTFTCSGVSAIGRCFVYTGNASLVASLGTTRTITAGALVADNCDFRDIAIAGGAAGTSPTGAGDCGGNSGINFPAAKTVYRVGTNTSWVGSSSWSLTSGDAGSNDNFPLAQDTAVINDDTTLTGVLSLAYWNVGTLDCSSRTTSVTINHGVTAFWHGSYTLGSGVTITGTQSQAFLGRGAMDFTSAGKTITFPITVQGPGGTFRLGDAFNSSVGITHERGTFNANDYNLSCFTFTSSVTSTRTLTMGSGLWTISGNSWSTSTVIGLTFDKGSADILLSATNSATRSFLGGGLSFNKLTIGGATGTSVLQFTGLNSFTELASTKTVAHTVRLGASLGTIGTWSVSGTSGNVVTVDSSTAGVRRLFNLTNVTSGIDYLSVKDIGCNQANRFYVGANSTDGGNNSNVIFTDPPAPSAATGNMLMLF